MTAKTEATIHNNGRADFAIRPDVIDLTPAMKQHLLRLVGDLEKAAAVSSAAKESEEVAQRTANAFLNYCAAELGAGNWRFDQASMTFVPPQTNEPGE